MKKENVFVKIKKKIGLTAALGWTAANFAGCGVYGPPTTVYGPPTDVSDDYSQSETVHSVDVTEPAVETEYNPADEDVFEIYGPPEDLDTSTYAESEDTPLNFEDTEESASTDEPVFDTSVNEAVCIYGPPEMMETYYDGN